MCLGCVALQVIWATNLLKQTKTHESKRRKDSTAAGIIESELGVLDSEARVIAQLQKSWQAGHLCVWKRCAQCMLGYLFRAEFGAVWGW